MLTPVNHQNEYASDPSISIIRTEQASNENNITTRETGEKNLKLRLELLLRTFSFLNLVRMLPSSLSTRSRSCSLFWQLRMSLINTESPLIPDSAIPTQFHASLPLLDQIGAAQRGQRTTPTHPPLQAPQISLDSPACRNRDPPPLAARDPSRAFEPPQLPQISPATVNTT